jgi:hypothetical protein
MKYKIPVLLSVFIFLMGLEGIANPYDEIWKLLLNNKRDDALAKLYKINKSNDAIEGLLLEQLIKSQLGHFEFDNDLIEKGKQKGKEFEYILSAYQAQNFFFGDYNSEGLYKHQISKLKALENYTFQSSTVRDSYKYLLSNMYLTQRNFAKKLELGNTAAFIKQWKCVGPFENLNNSGIHEKYVVEDSIDLESYDANSNGILSWYTLNNISGEPYTTLRAHQQYGAGTTYLKTYLNADKSKEILLHFGSNAAFKVWLNGKEIYLNEYVYNTDLDYFKVKTQLNEGKNLLLIKLGHQNYPYLSCKITNTDGSETTGIDRNLNEKGLTTNTLEQASEILENEILAYFKSIEEDRFFLSKISSIVYNSRNGVKEKARETIQEMAIDYPNSSLLNSLMLLCLDDDSKEQQSQGIYAEMEVQDSMYYLPYLIKISNADQMFKMSVESFDELVNKLDKMYNLKQITQLLDLLRFGKKNDLVGMKEVIENIIREYESNPKITHDMALVLGNLGYKSRMEEILIQMNEKYYYYPVISSLAYMYKDKGDISKSKEILLSASEILEYDFNFHENTGIFLFDNADYSEAKKHFEKALEIYPNSFKTQEKIGDILVQEKKQKEALVFYNKSLLHNNGHYALRQKIKNISVRQDILDKHVVKDQYDLIKSLRGKKYNDEVSLNILCDETNIMVYKEGGTKHRVYIAYEIITEQGIDLVKEIDLGLYNNYYIYAMEIIKKDGQRIPADKDGSHGVFNGLGVGDIVYLDYEFNDTGSGRFHKDFYYKFQLGGFYPTSTQKLRIFLPEGESINYSNCNQMVEPTIMNKDGYQIFEWSKNNIAEAPVNENYIKNKHDIFPYVHISTIKSWNEISKWYSDLVNSQFEDSKMVQNLFSSLFPNGYKMMTEKERAKIIYKYMSENLNYSFVSFRQSGFVPQKPEKTIRTKLGDCKDFSTLFAILAKKAEIDVELVLVLTSDNGQQSMIKPNTEFNHCIVKAKLDNNDYYIELTDKYLPFLAAPNSLINAAALEVSIKSDKKERKDIFTITAKNMLKNYLDLKVDHFVSKANQHIVLTYEIGGAGVSYYNSIFREGQENYKAKIKENLSRYNIKEFIVDSIHLISQNDFSSSVIFKVHISVKDAFQKVGKTVLLPLYLFDKIYTQDILVEKRNYVFNYQAYEDKEEYTTEYNLILDKDMYIKEIPDNFTSSFKENVYSLNFIQSGDKAINIKRKFTTSKKDIQPDEYTAFKDHVRAVLDAEAAFIGIGTTQN